MITIRIIIVVANYYGWLLCQMDVKTTFLNGMLTEKVFIKQPEGFIKNNNLICKPNKSLYGLKQSSKCWNDCFNDFIISLDFERSKPYYIYYCLYYKGNCKLKLFILL